MFTNTWNLRRKEDEEQKRSTVWKGLYEYSVNAPRQKTEFVLIIEENRF